jgi:hypothetical protein
MAKGNPILQNGIRHECITPVSTLDNELGIRSLADYVGRARYIPEGEPGGNRAAKNSLQNLKTDENIDAPSRTVTSWRTARTG